MNFFFPPGTKHPLEIKPERSLIIWLHKTSHRFLKLHKAIQNKTDPMIK